MPALLKPARGRTPLVIDALRCASVGSAQLDQAGIEPILDVIEATDHSIPWGFQEKRLL